MMWNCHLLKVGGAVILRVVFLGIGGVREEEGTERHTRKRIRLAPHPGRVFSKAWKHLAYKQRRSKLRSPIRSCWGISLKYLINRYTSLISGRAAESLKPPESSNLIIVSCVPFKVRMYPAFFVNSVDFQNFESHQCNEHGFANRPRHLLKDQSTISR